MPVRFKHARFSVHGGYHYYWASQVVVKNLPANEGDEDYRGAWQATVHGITKSWTQRSY